MNSSDQKLDIGFASPNLLNDTQKPISPSLSRSTEKWMLSNVYPLLFRIALFGLYVLFFIYKCFLVSLFSLYKYRNRFLKMIRGTQNTRKRVVVVGGGYAGLCASHSLEDEFDVTLIDTKDYYEFTPSRLRTLVEPHHCFKVQIKYSDILTKSHIITDRASQATTSGVFTSNGEYFAFDYLVVCTGSRYKESLFPTTSIDPQLMPTSQKTAIVLSARTERIDTYHSTLSDANKILIVGGGTVGVELASEIIERFPQKEVVLIHSQSKLMNRSPEHAIVYTEQFFKKNNVTVITNERLIAQNGSFFKTDQGTIIEADLAFVCTGNVPNSELLQHDFPQHLNKYGFVKVNKNLQLNGCDNIFVAGDLTDIPEEEEKLCQTAYSEIKVVIANIYNQESGKSLKTYVPSKCPMLVSLGKYDGILTYRGWTMTGFLPAVMKEFVEWKEMVWYWNWTHFQLNRHQKFIDDEYIEKPGKSHDV